MKGPAEFGEWAHGWQYVASSNKEHYFKKNHIVAYGTKADNAHLRSHSGPGSAAALGGAPTAPEYTIELPLFRTLVLERLRQPLPLTHRFCEGCGELLDRRGIHRGACMRTGRLRIRAVPLERSLARVCREAGAVVHQNALFRDMNISVNANDKRQIEVLADGLPYKRGCQLACDATLRSALCSDGTARPRAHAVSGAVADGARAYKEEKYPELADSARSVLVVVAIKIGGRC